MSSGKTKYDSGWDHVLTLADGTPLPEDFTNVDGAIQGPYGVCDRCAGDGLEVDGDDCMDCLGSGTNFGVCYLDEN